MLKSLIGTNAATMAGMNDEPTTFEDAMTVDDFATEYDDWASELEDRGLAEMDLEMGKF